MAEVEVKKAWQSKTVWKGVIVSLVGILVMLGVMPESVHLWMVGNEGLILTILGGISVGLRLITNGKVVLKD